MFILTASDKLLHWNKHTNVMKNYRILKDVFIIPSMMVMVLLEFFICISLFFYGANLYNLIVFLSLISAYTTAIIINLYRGNTNISCGCGSFLESSNLSYKLVLRNLSLIVLFLFIFLNAEYKITQLTFYEGSVLLILSICLILLWSIIKEFLESKKTLKKILKVYYLGGTKDVA